ncbi:hypothetical protein [Povalibacter sp.]|uniref:hypothetical protein n=1 Tax=Povalibacter sp. TaxID=1962978 RepID=UPI002F41E7B0
MARRPRIQIPGGTYYVLQSSSPLNCFFREDEDYDQLESLLSHALRRSGTEAFAFCWLPHQLHLAVRSADIPIGRFMQGFTSRYSQFVHRRRRDAGHLFLRRFESLLIEADAWLPELVRFLHQVPVRAGLTEPQRCVRSSVGAYLGTHPIAWLTTTTPLRILQKRGLDADAARRYLLAPPTDEEAGLLSTNGHRSSRVLGSPKFLRSLARSPVQPRQRLTLMQLVDTIALTQDVPRTDILSISRRRSTSLARSLIAWHATHRRIATLAEVSRLLGRDLSTLSKAIIRHRRIHPQLFRSDALSHLHPLT